MSNHRELGESLLRLEPEDQVELLQQVELEVLLRAVHAAEVEAPVDLLRRAKLELANWAGTDDSKKLFADEVEDIIRRLVAEEASI